MGICVKKIKNEWPNNDHFCAVMHGNGVETCNFEKMIAADLILLF